MPATAVAPSRVGETKSFGGHTYRLGESHRWEREDKDQPTQGQQSAGGKKPPQPPTTQTPAEGQPTPDPAATHAFTKGQLGSVDEPIRGVMSALHSHPDTQSTGTVRTPDVAPQSARQLYAYLRQNAAQPVGGAAAVGQAVDLGQGKLGYSSPAGAIVIGPADSSGKHQIQYTNQTGVVKRAMGGGQAGPVQDSPASRPSPQQGLPASSAAVPTGNDPKTPGPMAPQRMPAAASANSVPPSRPGQYVPQQEGPPPVVGSSRARAIGSGQGDPGEPTPVPSPAKPPMAQGTPEQLAAPSVLMDKPQPAKVPDPPKEPSSPREAADQAKNRLMEATKKWQDEVGGGLTPKGNARWRSYTAALRSIWNQHEQMARDWEKKSKGGGKASGGKGPAKPAVDDELAGMEQRVTDQQPGALKQIKELTQSPNAYRHMVEQYHDQLFPAEASKRKAAGNPNSDLGKSVAKRASEGKKSQVKAGDQTGMLSGMGGGISDSMYDNLWSKVESGDTNEAGAPSALLQVAQAARKSGGMSAPEHLRALAKDYADVKGKGLKGDEFQNAMRGLVTKHGTKPDESGAMDRAGIDPQSGKPRETKSQLEARLRREAAAGIAPDVPKPVQPKPIEGSDDWKRLVKSKASEWDMKPEDFHDLATDLHRELVEHHGQRKEAYLHASKAAGLKPADINRLENKGFDNGSQHKDIKQLDTIGRDLASQYPALGWGRGREDDSNDEGDIDYGAKVWDLIREGYQPPPGKHSSEFMDHIEDYLRSQLKHHGSSGTPGGNVATDDDLSAVPFAKVRDGLLIRYQKWLLERSPSLDFTNTIALN